MRAYYSDGASVLFHGRYEDGIKLVGDGVADLVLTDPPFGTTDLEWDKRIDTAEFWVQINRLSKEAANVLTFAAQPFTTDMISSNRKNFRYELIFEKANAVGWLSANRRPLRAHENMLLFNRKPGKATYNAQLIPGAVYTHSPRGMRIGVYGWHKDELRENAGTRHPRSVQKYSRDKKIWHPTQKPFGLIDWIVKSYSNQGDLVVDTFAGSGQTMVAAKINGRRSIGFEMDEKYCEVIANRLRAASLN